MPIYLGKPKFTNKNVGKSNVPQDIKRRRRDVENIMRRMGTPMLHKPRYNDFDLKLGIVDQSTAYDDIYGQTRNRDPLSHGVGYMSKELSEDEWYSDEGVIVKSQTSPGPAWKKAPKYRGYGPGTITYIIEPDRSEDFYKATTGGPIFKVMTAMAIAPWWPDIDDNDMLIHVELGQNEKIVNVGERFEVKNVTPVSMRGTDRRGRKEVYDPQGFGTFGNAHLMNQQFEMNLIPHTDVLYQVETDR